MAHGEKILVIGRHADMLAKIVNLLQQHGYHPMGETTNEGAMLAFKTNTIDAIVIGGGVDSESRNLFHTMFSTINPTVKIIDAHPPTVLNDLQLAFADKN